MVVEYHEYREAMKRAREDKQQLETTVAELVALLRRGKALYSSGVASGSLRQQGWRDDARVQEAEARLILDDYSAAIAKHGGE